MCCRSNQKDRPIAVPGTTANALLSGTLQYLPPLALPLALDVALTATYLPCLVALPSIGCSIVVELPALTAIEEVAVADTVDMNKWDF